MKIITIILIVIILVLMGVITINAQVIQDSSRLDKIRDVTQEKINNLFGRERVVEGFKESTEINKLCLEGERCREFEKLSVDDSGLIYEGTFKDSGEKIIVIKLG